MAPASQAEAHSYLFRCPAPHMHGTWGWARQARLYFGLKESLCQRLSLAEAVTAMGAVKLMLRDLGCPFCPLGTYSEGQNFFPKVFVDDTARLDNRRAVPV